MKHKIKNPDYGDGRTAEHETIIEALKEYRVMSISREGEAFILEEACDGWFKLELTPAQLRAFGEELIAASQT